MYISFFLYRTLALLLDWKHQVLTNESYVTILFFSNNTYHRSHFVDFIDDVYDISAAGGVLTWRRSGQPTPDGMLPVAFFSPKDAQEGLVADAVQAVFDHLGFDRLKVNDAIRAVEKIQAAVRLAIASGEGWGYVHSKKYDELVANAKAEAEADADALANNVIRPLAAWEESLLNHNDKAPA
jgi:hypothetical protein